MILGYPVTNLCIDEIVGKVLCCLKSEKSVQYMTCANPHSLVEASKDKQFEEALKNSDILLPDGTGIILAAKLLGVDVKKKIAGFDFFWSVSKAVKNKKSPKYFFIGSTNNVLESIVSRLSNDFPYIVVCGTYSPPFKTEFSDEDNEEMVRFINRARPDILWVGMTAPKQEKWIYSNRHRLNVPFIGAIGAVFDFYAGSKKRSSELWQKLGLEWLPRFLREPRRLFRRNMISTPVFLLWVLKTKLRLLGDQHHKT